MNPTSDHQQPILGFAPLFAQQPVNPKFRSKQEEDDYNRYRELGQDAAPLTLGCCCLFVVALIALVIVLIVRLSSRKSAGSGRGTTHRIEDDLDDDRPRRRRRDDDE